MQTNQSANLHAGTVCRKFCLHIITVLSNINIQNFQKAVFRHLCQQNSIVENLTQIFARNNWYPYNTWTKLHSHLSMVRSSWCYSAEGENTAGSILITFIMSESNWLYLNEKHMSTPQASFLPKRTLHELGSSFLFFYPPTLFPVNCCDYQTCQTDCIMDDTGVAMVNISTPNKHLTIFFLMSHSTKGI